MLLCTELFILNLVMPLIWMKSLALLINHADFFL